MTNESIVKPVHVSQPSSELKPSSDSLETRSVADIEEFQEELNDTNFDEVDNASVKMKNNDEFDNIVEVDKNIENSDSSDLDTSKSEVIRPKRMARLYSKGSFRTKISNKIRSKRARAIAVIFCFDFYIFIIIYNFYSFLIETSTNEKTNERENKYRH